MIVFGGKVFYASNSEQVGLTAEQLIVALSRDGSACRSLANAISGIQYGTWHI